MEKIKYKIFYDRTLLWLSLGLVAVGFIIVMSSSISVGIRIYNDPFYFSKKNIFSILFSFFISFYVLQIPINLWKYHSIKIFLFTLFMLIVVLFFGISINGSCRWLNLGFFYVQPSEISKLSSFFYLSKYLEQNFKKIRIYFFYFLKPLGIISIFLFLLLEEPDLGASIVLFSTAIIVLFLAGSKLKHISLILFIGIILLIISIFAKPYRIKRIMSFWNLWDESLDKGYQLTQSLMAFGIGNIWGQGLGNSIHKLNYLPEAHTDFILAIFAEEFGFFGTIILLIMLFLISFRAIYIGKKALEKNEHFSGFLAYSIGISLILQTIINIGTTSGLLPTKGLTLPLVSYGGSSLTITLISIAILLRIDYESRLKKYKYV